MIIDICSFTLLISILFYFVYSYLILCNIERTCKKSRKQDFLNINSLPILKLRNFNSSRKKRGTQQGTDNEQNHYYPSKVHLNRSLS